MIGYVGLVQQGLLGEIKPDQNEALQTSLQHSNKLLGMISDILEATKLQARSVNFERTKVSLQQILNDLKSAYEHASIPRELTLSWHIPPDLPLVEIDESKFKQILKSLIDNAIKLTPAGTVQISVPDYLADGSLKVQVSDTGRGIPKD